MCKERHAVSPSAFILTLVIVMVVFSFIPPNIEKKVPPVATTEAAATPFDEIVWGSESEPVPMPSLDRDIMPLFKQYNPATDRDGFVGLIGPKLGLDHVWYRYLYDVTADVGTE